MFNIDINGKTVQAEPGEMLLAVCRRAGIDIPTLCNIDGLQASGSCRMCVVEVEGQRALVPSCAFPVFEGMGKVHTHSTRVINARKTIVELLLADHPNDCLYCERSGNCKLQALAQELGVRSHRYNGRKSENKLDSSSASIVRDANKCILCGRCIRVCEEIQSVSCIDFIHRGSNTIVGTAFNEGMNLSSCVNCGQCTTVCPTGALTAQSQVQRVLDALMDPNMHVVAQHAPAVSISIGEEFGLPLGEDSMGRMHAALRKIGFDKVFDTSFSADLTIMEEGTELLTRIKTGGVLPMFTSCSPGWIKFVETFYPEFRDNLSTCKSPQQMLGAVIKTFYAEKVAKIDPRKVFSVSIMPCTAKKFECARPEMGREGYADVDAVLTTRELAEIFKMFGLNLGELESEPADSPFGERSSAGKLFGVSGGVMEAALRTAYRILEGQELPGLKIEACRGIENAKEAHIPVHVDGKEVVLGIAIVNSLGSARKLLDQLKAGERKDIHFIEVMTCPGGCVGGGGQPFGTNTFVLRGRMQGLYNIDEAEKLRTSHANSEVQRLYDEYLGEPNGHLSHELLHTKYQKRDPLV